MAVEKEQNADHKSLAFDVVRWRLRGADKPPMSSVGGKVDEVEDNVDVALHAPAACCEKIVFDRVDQEIDNDEVSSSWSLPSTPSLSSSSKKKK